MSFQDYDEINDVGAVYFNACTPIETSGIEITVTEAWDDTTPRRQILLTCQHGNGGVVYRMDCDKAEALGLLLVSAAKSMREMIGKLELDSGK